MSKMRVSVLSAVPVLVVTLVTNSANAQEPSGKPVASGTGFFITEDGYLVTNDHVVRDSKKVRVRTPTQTLDATLVRSSKAFDLAVLKVEGKFRPLHLAFNRPIQLGDAVFTIGFPNTEIQGTEPKYSDGKVSSLSGIEDDPSEYQISVPVQPGNSGGPLVTQDGAVVGVVRAKLDDLAALLSTGSVPQNVNYAVKIKYLKDLIEPVPGLLAAIARPDMKMPGPDAVNTAKDATVIVLVYDTPLPTISTSAGFNRSANLTPIPTTTPAGDWKVVAGKAYAMNSPEWTQIRGSILVTRILKHIGTLECQEYTTETVQGQGRFGVGGAIVSTYRDVTKLGKSFVLTNYPTELWRKAEVGQDIPSLIKVMLVGSASDLPVYDCGIPIAPQVRTLTPAEAQAAKVAADKKKAAQDAAVLTLHQDLAAKGDPYGLYRMGKRYVEGDGVPADMTRAKEFLTRASINGSSEAAELLTRLVKEEGTFLKR